MLKDIFLRRVPSTEVLHNDIKTSINTHILPLLGGSPVTILDLLAYPLAGGTLNHTSATLATTKQKLRAQPMSLFNDLGVFSHIQCAMMKAAQDWVRELSNHQILLEPVENINPHKLEDLAITAQKPSLALVMKYAWIYRGADRHYYGFPSCTSPVRASMKLLFGQTSPNNGAIMKAHFSLAQELDLDPLVINSILYLIGMDLK